VWKKDPKEGPVTSHSYRQDRQGECIPKGKMTNVDRVGRERQAKEVDKPSKQGKRQRVKGQAVDK
jgi:hypothetical protein